MSSAREKALATLAKLQGTSIEAQVEKYNADVIERRASMKVKPALSEDERGARSKASKQRSLVKAKQMRAAVRALKPAPTAEETAAKLAARKANHKVAARKHRVTVRDERRAQRALRTARGLGPLPLQSPTIAEAHQRISRMLAGVVCEAKST